MKRIAAVLAALAFIIVLAPASSASVPESGEYDLGGFDTSAQLEALGKGELMDSVPGEARDLMEDNGIYDMSVQDMLGLSPGNFFSALWSMLLTRIKGPFSALGTMLGVILLCAFLNGLKTAAWDSQLSGIFGTVCVLCMVLLVAAPIVDCIIYTSNAIRQASLFMASFIPIFSAAMIAAGQPATGAAYNMFLFSTCQVVSQVASQTLVPFMGIYLAVCITGSLLPGLNVSSAADALKNIAIKSLGLLLTMFVGILSIQSMVSAGTDTVSARAAKFLIGSFVPVVGSALSDAYTAAQGCLKLIKTSVGAYGVIVAFFTFLPVLLNALIWYGITNAGIIAGDIVGVPAVSSVLKACAGVLGMLIAVILCYALLLIVSTTVVLVTGMGTG